MAKENAKKKEDATEEKEDAKPEQAEGEEGAEGAEGEAKPKKSKKKIIIIGVLALLLLVGGGAGAYFAGLIGGQGKGGDDSAGAGSAEKPVFYTLPDFLVNLNTGGKATSFLKTTVILEVAKQEDIAVIEANIPRLMDAVNTYLRELRASDLSGSAGIQRLREELLIRANKSLAPVKINDVLFKEIVVQ
ncbi:MAG: flagellar basal body-associated FliL family protein [Rickettsiales bacterium]|jgi:flagellar FliL protein|nr:flagellar basal body-associated FliL family protein [Rickettsiales bacterium]